MNTNNQEEDASHAEDSDEAHHHDQTLINIWTHIWFQPTTVFQQVKQHYGWGSFYLLLFIYAIVAMMLGVTEAYYFPEPGDEMEEMAPAAEAMLLAFMLLFAILLSVVVFGLMILGSFISAYFQLFTGRLLGGQAKFRDICLVGAFCIVPYIELTALQGIVTLVVGLLSGVQNNEGSYILYTVIAGLANFAMWIFVLVLNSRGLAVVQGYHSAWRGFGNLILAGLLLALIVLVLLLLGFAAYILILG